MTVRVTFRSEVYIDASSVAEAKEKFEAMELYSEKAKKEMNADFVEINSIEEKLIKPISLLCLEKLPRSLRLRNRSRECIIRNLIVQKWS